MKKKLDGFLFLEGYASESEATISSKTAFFLI